MLSQSVRTHRWTRTLRGFRSLELSLLEKLWWNVYLFWIHSDFIPTGVSSIYFLVNQRPNDIILVCKYGEIVLEKILAKKNYMLAISLKSDLLSRMICGLNIYKLLVSPIPKNFIKFFWISTIKIPLRSKERYL